MYSALEVAKYIIKRCNELDKSISNLKLQKILYFIQAEFLVVKDEPCFEERIEAWDFGPVVPVVYKEYKIYGSTSIPYLDDSFLFSFDSDDKETIDTMIEESAKFTAATLVEITHNQAPWKEAYRPFHSVVITNDSIKRYFKEEQ